MKRVIAAIILTVALAGCGTSISSENQGNGTCLNTTKKQAFGITYSSDQNVQNCDPE